MLRKVLGLVGVTVAAGLAVAGCAPVKMGSAAIVGNNSISIAQLDTNAGKLTSAVKKYPSSQGSMTQLQITQATLTWLIRFQIAEHVASQNNIAVTDAQEQAAIASLIQNEQEQAEESNQPTSSVTIEAIMVGAGIPPNLQSELGRWLAIEDAYVAKVNGGKLPTTQSEATAAENKYNHAGCLAAKSLNIKVNPQFGRMNYSSAPYSVVSATDTVSRASGAKPSSAPGGLTPKC